MSVTTSQQPRTLNELLADEQHARQAFAARLMLALTLLLLGVLAVGVAVFS